MFSHSRMQIIRDMRRPSSHYVTRGRLRFRFAQVLLNAVALLAIAGGLAAYFKCKFIIFNDLSNSNRRVHDRLKLFFSNYNHRYQAILSRFISFFATFTFQLFPNASLDSSRAISVFHISRAFFLPSSWKELSATLYLPLLSSLLSHLLVRSTPWQIFPAFRVSHFTATVKAPSTKLAFLIPLTFYTHRTNTSVFDSNCFGEMARDSELFVFFLQIESLIFTPRIELWDGGRNRHVKVSPIPKVFEAKTLILSLGISFIYNVHNEDFYNSTQRWRNGMRA